MECASCGADIDAMDRYCPACRLPNMQGSRHPRFGPAERDPGPAIAPRVAAEGERPCPRCRSGLRTRDHYCRSCGLDVSRLAPPPPISRTGGVWMTPGPLTVDSYQPLGRLSVVMRVLMLVIDRAGGRDRRRQPAAVAHDRRRLAARPPGCRRSTRTGSCSTSGCTAWRWPRPALLVVVALLTVAWTRRGYRNLGCLGVTGRRLAPFWATYGWLIPGVNLIVPKLIVDDTWRASDPDLPSGSARWRPRPVPTANHMWWISTIVALPTVALALAAILSTGDRPVDLAEVHATQGRCSCWRWPRCSWCSPPSCSPARSRASPTASGPGPPASARRPDPSCVRPVGRASRPSGGPDAEQGPGAAPLGRGGRKRGSLLIHWLDARDAGGRGVPATRGARRSTARSSRSHAPDAWFLKGGLDRGRRHRRARSGRSFVGRPAHRQAAAARRGRRPDAWACGSG